MDKLSLINRDIEEILIGGKLGVTEDSRNNGASTVYQTGTRGQESSHQESRIGGEYSNMPRLSLPHLQ